MTFQPGDLVLIPFPFSDLPTAKRRPVLVMTEPDERGDFIGLAVTSAPTVERALVLDYEALRDGSLPKRSWVRMDKIFTLNAKLAEGVFARTSSSFLDQVLLSLCDILGLGQASARTEE